MSGPDNGHQFHLSAQVQGSYSIGDDPQHFDSDPGTMVAPFTLTVRAWSLPEACRIAGQASLAEWHHPELAGEVAPAYACSQCGSSDWRLCAADDPHGDTWFLTCATGHLWEGSPGQRMAIQVTGIDA